MSDIVQRLISAAEDFPEIEENPSYLYCAASVEIQHLRARLAAAEADACNSPAIAAIEYALSHDDSETFLRLWFMGDFEALRAEWDDVPDAVFIGADPLFEPNAIEAARGGE